MPFSGMDKLTGIFFQLVNHVFESRDVDLEAFLLSQSVLEERLVVRVKVVVRRLGIDGKRLKFEPNRITYFGTSSCSPNWSSMLTVP